jgi:hypothetical protein
VINHISKDLGPIEIGIGIKAVRYGTVRLCRQNGVSEKLLPIIPLLCANQVKTTLSLMSNIYFQTWGFPCLQVGG